MIPLLPHPIPCWVHSLNFSRGSSQSRLAGAMFGKANLYLYVLATCVCARHPCGCLCVCEQCEHYSPGPLLFAFAKNWYTTCLRACQLWNRVTTSQPCAGTKTRGMTGKNGVGWMACLLAGCNGGWANRAIEEQMDNDKKQENLCTKCNEESEWFCLSQFELNWL